MKLEQSPEWEDPSRLHLEGRTAAFFCYNRTRLTPTIQSLLRRRLK